MPKYAIGICDLCGLRYKHKDLRKNWMGQMVCDDDFEMRHPQDLPTRKRLDDPKPIKDARPDQPIEEMDEADLLENHKPSTAGQEETE